MKSIYESIKDIMLEYQMGNIGKDATKPGKPPSQQFPLKTKAEPKTAMDRIGDAIKGTIDNRNKSVADDSTSISNNYSRRNTPGFNPRAKNEKGEGNVAITRPGAEKQQARTVVPEPKKAPVVRSEPKQAPNPNQSTVDASNKTNQAAVAKMKEIESGGSGEGKDRFSGQANTDKNTGGNALKATSAQPAEPKKDDSFKSAGPLPGTVGGGGALAPEVKPASEKPQASTVATPASHTVDTKDTEQFRTKTYTKPEKQEPDTTVRSGSGDAVTTGSGGNLRTDTPDEIAQRGPFGQKTNKPKKTNENFGVSDKLYTDVMEVLKKSNVQGSKPRNDREKELATAYGDPNRITHGDVLKMRGVTKEDVEQVEENDVGYQQKGGTKAGHALYSKKLSDEPQTSKSDVTLQSGATSHGGKSYKFPKGTKFVSLPGGIFGQHPDVPETHPKFGHLIKGSEDNIVKIHKSLVKENKDTPGNSYEHQCAIHVKSESFGEGRTITTQHADPDENGNIAWYDVMFEHGIEKAVPTSELEILVSEMHMHSKRKKKAM